MATRKKLLTSPIHDGETLEKIKSADERVRWSFPGREGDRKGTRQDRAIILSNPESVGVPYWDVVDLIAFPGDKRKWIRIGYYRRKAGGRLVWAGQTTICEPISVWKRLLVETAEEKPWFRRLLESVMRELE